MYQHVDGHCGLYIWLIDHKIIRDHLHSETHVCAKNDLGQFCVLLSVAQGLPTDRPTDMSKILFLGDLHCTHRKNKGFFGKGLSFSQTSPGFYVSAVQAFWKHCGKRRNAHTGQFLLFLVFSTLLENFLPFWSNFIYCLQTLSVWKRLKFVVWERLNFYHAMLTFNGPYKRKRPFSPFPSMFSILPKTNLYL